MTVEIYLSRRFEYAHERRALGEFLMDLHECFAQSERLYCVVVEPQVDDHEIDLLLLSQSAIIVVELKHLGQAEGHERKLIHLLGGENGSWHYRLPSGSLREHRGNNPYRQAGKMRHALAEWLDAHLAGLPGGAWTSKKAHGHVLGWVTVSPGFDDDTSDLDLPRAGWFKVVSLERLAAEFDTARETGLRLSPAQVRQVVEALGVARASNLRELIPNYVPSSPIFNTQPPGRSDLIDREAERQALAEAVDGARLSTLVLLGPAGAGRTALARHLVHLARERHYRIRWLDCAEHAGLTLDSLLSAISAEIPGQARLIIRNPQQHLNDRIDAALEFLNQRLSLLVFDDYHALQHRAAIEAFVERAGRRHGPLLIALTARERVAARGWPAETLRQVELDGGLAFDDFAQFVDGTLHRVSLQPGELRALWQRLGGNPQACRLSEPLIRQYALMGRLHELPLPESESWFQSLIAAVSPEARRLAERLSALRAPLPFDALAGLAGLAPEAASQLVIELEDKYLLQAQPPARSFGLNDMARAMLYGRLPERARREAHQRAGDAHASLAAVSADELQRAEHLLEAAWHFEQGGPRKQLLACAEQAYPLLLAAGDHERALLLADSALQAARAAASPAAQADWLLRAADLCLHREQASAARARLEQAAACLPAAGRKPPAAQRRAWQQREQQLALLRGRAAYHAPRYKAAQAHFERALRLTQAAGDQPAATGALLWLGRVARHRQDYAAAAAHFEVAIGIARARGDQQAVCDGLSHLGLIARSQGRGDEARRLFAEAFEVAAQAGYALGAEISLGHLGRTALLSGDFAEAERIFRDCLEQARQLRSPRGVRIQLINLTEALIGQRRYAEAETVLADAAERSAQAEDGIGQAWVLKQRGQIAKGRGQAGLGNDLIRQGLAKLRELNNKEYLADFERALQQGSQLALGLE
jgi:tetratricopeptide (TPR) repeat protein